MTDRVVEALCEIAPVARGQVAVTQDGRGERLRAQKSRLRDGRCAG
jgi:hypothetical protein